MGFIKSFHCALCGILDSVVSERNLRIHIVAAMYILYFSRFYTFTRAEYILLALTICLVIATEMLNTAIEAAVDLVTEEYARLAKAAKDIAAGAVLVVAVFAVFVGVMLFLDLNVIMTVIEYFAHGPLRIVILLLTAAISVLFILKIGHWVRFVDKRYGYKNGGNDAKIKK